MGDITGTGDVIGRLHMDIGDDPRQDIHVMGVPALATPVDVTGRALAEELMQRKPGERAEMRVGQMRELEHALALALARGRQSSAPMARLDCGKVGRPQLAAPVSSDTMRESVMVTAGFQT